MAKSIDMTGGSPARNILSFAWPILLGYLFHQVYSLADKVIVGQFVGDAAFAAIGTTAAGSNIFMSFSQGMCAGSGVVAAQFFGAKDDKGSAKAVVNGLYVTALLAAVLTFGGIALTDPLLNLLGTPESLMRDASVYMKIYLGGSLAVAMYYTPFSILQAFGDSKTPLIFQVISSVLNIILDILFVIPPLNWGVAGAAIATVIAQIVAAILCIAYSVKKVPQFREALHHLKPDLDVMMRIVRIGVPSGFQYALVFISSLFLQAVVNGFGETTVGEFTATTQIEMLSIQVPNAVAAAMLTYVGQNIGAGRLNRVGQGLRSAFGICVAASLAIAGVIWLFGEPIMSIFVSDNAIISLAARGMQIESLFLMGYALTRVTLYALNGAGDSGFSMVNGIVEIAAKIAFTFALTAVPVIGVWGIWLTTGCTWIVTAVTALIRYRTGAWKKKSVV